MKYLCTAQNACLCRCVIVNFTVGAFICNFFQQFWPFKKPIARMQVAFTLRNNNGERESISLLQILRKMVCGNFTTFSITLVFLQSKFLNWNKASGKWASLVYIVYLFNHSHTSEPVKISTLWFFANVVVW